MAVTRRLFGYGLAIGILCAAGWILYHQLAALSWSALTSAVAATPRWRILAALGLTGVSFLSLAAYDVIAVQTVAPGRLPAWLAAFAGAAGNAVSNTLGFHPITGSAVRFRLYRRYGLSMGSTARVIALSWTSLGLGFATTLGISLIVTPVDDICYRAAGIAIVVAVGLLVVWMSRKQRVLRVAGQTLELPSGWRALAQVAIGAIETAATIGALLVLVPSSVAPSFPIFAMAFISAVLLGIVSHAPGGAGVFEAAMLSLFPAGHAPFLAALLVFRAIYNLLPFVVAVAALALFEISSRKGNGG